MEEKPSYTDFFLGLPLVPAGDFLWNNRDNATVKDPGNQGDGLIEGTS